MTAPLTAPLPYSVAELVEMRNWISDCVWSDLEPDDVTELSDRAVVNGIRRNYDGGIAQFIADLETYGPESYYQP